MHDRGLSQTKLGVHRVDTQAAGEILMTERRMCDCATSRCIDLTVEEGSQQESEQGSVEE